MACDYDERRWLLEFVEDVASLLDDYRPLGAFVVGDDAEEGKVFLENEAGVKLILTVETVD